MLEGLVPNMSGIAGSRKDPTLTVDTPHEYNRIPHQIILKGDEGGDVSMWCKRWSTDEFHQAAGVVLNAAEWNKTVLGNSMSSQYFRSIQICLHDFITVYCNVIILSSWSFLMLFLFPLCLVFMIVCRSVAPAAYGSDGPKTN
jgi:hypothetical protein